MGSKRAITETLADEDVSKQESHLRKKSRKDKVKSSESTTPTVSAEEGLKDDRKEKKKSKKRKDDATTELESGAASEAANGTAEESELSKAERKAAKRAKKEAKAAAKLQAENGAAVVEGVAEDSEEKPKAERKAEKARKKEEKEKKRTAKLASSASDTATTDATISNSTSATASKVQSSVTSLEATPVPTTGSAKYVEDPKLSALPQSEIGAYLSKHFITINDPLTSGPKYRPITSFSYLPITDEAQRAPFASFSAPTPIQAAAWPSLFAGRDMVGVAETGSGKTMAFGVPCIRAIAAGGKQKGVKAVIVSPTRELAMQIFEQLVKLAKPAGLGVVCVYGGVPKEQQIRDLKTASVVVATPGRLNDLINDGAANLSKANFVVLDEADRMLDKGFEDDIRKIISSTASEGRQTLMFTATWPESVRKLASTFMKSPVRINIGDNPTGELRANTRITQTVEVVEPNDKQYRLLQLLRQHTAGKQKDDKILVFCLYKKEATRIEEFIKRNGFRVAGIHGDLSQQQRTASLDAFKQGKVNLLVATDVAARGLDIPEVKMVINVTFPLTVEDYVHRIGRTGRAGKEGKAITLFTEHDKALSGALINVLKGANQQVPEDLLKFGTTVKKKSHDAYGAFFKDTGDMKAATKITFDD